MRFSASAVRAGAVGLAALVVGGLGLRHLFRSPLDDLPATFPRARLARAVDSSARPKRPPPPSQDYVGSAACSQCHADICKKYQRHPMSQSLAHVDEASAIEDYEERSTFNSPPYAHWDVSLRYRIERDEKQVRHHEIALDPGGEIIYDQAVPIHSAIGSGRLGRSYVTNYGGVLNLSPIFWYSEKRRWDLAPGYVIQNSHFERQVQDGCLNCHAGRMATDPERPHHFQREPFLEAAIGCERCHGPGKKHVEHWLRPPEEGSRDPIVNPSDLEPDRRDSVCFQCHLSEEIRLTRYGRTHFDFRPGDDVLEIWTIFVRGTGGSRDQTTSAGSHASQMLFSACYRNSSRQMSCLSCHDPHSVPQPEDRVEFYRARCLTCHEANAPQCSVSLAKRRATAAEDSCIACHMPQLAANDVPHVAKTDHRVLRSYNSREKPSSPGDQLALTVFRGDAALASEAELERAKGLLILSNAERERNAVLAQEAIPRLRSWLDSAPDDTLAAEALGAAYALNHEVESAQKVWEDALVRDPDNEDLLRRLMSLNHDHGKIDQGIEYARRLVALNSWQHEYLGRLAHMLGLQRKFDEAIPIAERALEIGPSAVEIHGWLSEAYANKGDRERSLYHRQQFQKLAARR